MSIQKKYCTQLLLIFFFFAHLSLEAHAGGKYSSIVKSVAVQIIANKIINKIAPPNSQTIHYNIGLKTGVSVARIIYSLYDAAKKTTGKTFDEYENNLSTQLLSQTQCYNKLPHGKEKKKLLKRLFMLFQASERLKKIRIICNDLAKETNIHGASFFISEDAPLNACASSLLGSKKIFLDRSWLTINTADEVTLLKYIKAIIAHEFGHIALNHTHKGLARSFIETIGDGILTYRQEKATVKNVESYANDVMRSAQKTEYDPKLQDNYPRAKEMLNDPSFFEKDSPYRKYFDTANNLKRWNKARCILDYSLVFRSLTEQRIFEYQADAWASNYVAAQDLSQALTYIKSHYEDQKTGWWKIITDVITTHPAIERRIERLAQPHRLRKSPWLESECYKWWGMLP